MFDFEVPISLPDGGIYTVDFNFVGTQRVQQDNLMFTFYNLDEPYVNYVERLINKDDTKGIRLSEVGHTNITENLQYSIFIPIRKRQASTSILMNIEATSK